MYETQVTVVGRLTTDVGARRLNSGTTVANFRVASTERRRDHAGGEWGDGDTLYIDVRCWRSLAENAARSLSKGDPVVVTGRMFTREYEHEGQRRSTITLEARSVAADLAHCWVLLTRTRRGTAEAPDAGEVAHDGGTGQEVPQPDLVGVAPGAEG